MSALTGDQDVSQLDPIYAKRIVQDVGSSGQPPIYGYQFFTAGIDPYLTVLDEEYLKDYISVLTFRIYNLH